MRKIIYCADTIAIQNGRIVIIERLSSIRGLALPGGKQEPNEMLSDTATREFTEETGMQFTALGVLGTYAEDDRDPRGHYVSTVFTGTALGMPRDEPGKTHVLLLTKAEILEREREFVFDHFLALQNFFSINKEG